MMQLTSLILFSPVLPTARKTIYMEVSYILRNKEIAFQNLLTMLLEEGAGYSFGLLHLLLALG